MPNPTLSLYSEESEARLSNSDPLHLQKIILPQNFYSEQINDTMIFY